MYFLGIKLNEVGLWTRAAALLLATTCASGFAQSFSFESVGARIGASPTGNGHNFHQVEAFADLNLPWNWDLGDNWRLQSRLDVSLGWLGNPLRDAVIGTLGPSLLARCDDFPLSFEGGCSPTLLSRDDFGTKDFGELFQFTSHIGFNLDLTRHIRVGYRFQHMSNADISRNNPGLNLHMLKVSYLF